MTAYVLVITASTILLGGDGRLAHVNTTTGDTLVITDSMRKVQWIPEARVAFAQWGSVPLECLPERLWHKGSPGDLLDLYVNEAGPDTAMSLSELAHGYRDFLQRECPSAEKLTAWIVGYRLDPLIGKIVPQVWKTGSEWWMVNRLVQ